MTRERVVIIVDRDERANNGFLSYNGPTARYFAAMHGVTVESVEALPEPDRVQEFRVNVETRPGVGPWTRGGVERALINNYSPGTFTVTEVDPT